LELLKTIAPLVRRVAIVWDPSTGPAVMTAAIKSAGSLGLEFQVLEAKSFHEVEPRLRAFAPRRGDGVLFLSSPEFSSAVLKPLAALALKSRLPSVMLFTTFAKEGGLVAYGHDTPELYRQEGRIIAKILGERRLERCPSSVRRSSRWPSI
jgi:putative ABC transport system substrate-binding protein